MFIIAAAKRNKLTLFCAWQLSPSQNLLCFGQNKHLALPAH